MIISYSWPNYNLFANEYDIIKTTPKGIWIHDFPSKRWVSNKSKKRFAYPTKEEAITNYILRTKKYKQILSSRIEELNVYLRLAEDIKTKTI